ncbi:hypothetical protein CARUB_v10025023mg, partial [Capsella rubella]
FGFTCFVGGLDHDTSEDDLKKIFSKFGNVNNSQETGSSRGFGFVTFKDEKSLEGAILFKNGDEIDGSQINVEESCTRCVIVRSFTVKVARPRRLSRSDEFVQEFVRMIQEKEKKQMAGLI